MKKLIAIIALTALLASCLTYTAILFAAPGDVEITLRIRAEKVADFQAGFLAKCPIPMIEDYSDPNAIAMVPEYTPKQWIKEWIRRDVMRAYRHGKILLAQQAAITDPNAIQ